MERERMCVVAYRKQMWEGREEVGSECERKRRKAEVEKGRK